MEELATMMKRENLNEKMWELVRGWSDHRILNYFVNTLPIHMVEEVAEELEKTPKDEMTPNEAYTEGRRRLELLKRLESAIDDVGYDIKGFAKELSIDCQMPALEEFVTKLESMNGEKHKEWRVKLVSINIGLHPDSKNKMAIYGYFKCDLTKDELEACYRAWQRKKDFDFEVNLPEDVQWKLDTNLREVSDKVSENAGWTRYYLGDPC